jgi:hypothetical protein
MPQRQGRFLQWTQQAQNIRGQMYVPGAKFEPTTPLFGQEEQCGLCDRRRAKCRAVMLLTSFVFWAQLTKPIVDAGRNNCAVNNTAAPDIYRTLTTHLENKTQ